MTFEQVGQIIGVVRYLSLETHQYKYEQVLRYMGRGDFVAALVALEPLDREVYWHLSGILNGAL